jgi:hypothetical protein
MVHSQVKVRTLARPHLIQHSTLTQQHMIPHRTLTPPYLILHKEVVRFDPDYTKVDIVKTKEGKYYILGHVKSKIIHLMLIL